jgi:hypothetical protein
MEFEVIACQKGFTNHIYVIDFVFMVFDSGCPLLMGGVCCRADVQRDVYI